MCLLQQQEQDPTNLYISNLPAYVSEIDLEAMFSSYGKVISTRILRDPQGTSRGVGFARMDTKETCDAIINAFNGKYLNGLFCLFAVYRTFSFYNFYKPSLRLVNRLNCFKI